MTQSDLHDFIDEHFGGLDWNRDRRPPIELPVTGADLDKVDKDVLDVGHL